MRSLTIAICATALSCVQCLWANIDAGNFDASVRPQDDFNGFANGGWIKANPVPSAFGSWGAFNEVDEHNKIALRRILEKAARADHPGPIERQVGDFFASGMDEAAIEAAGIAPIQPEFSRLANIKTGADIQVAIAHLHRLRVNAGFAFSVG